MKAYQAEQPFKCEFPPGQPAHLSPLLFPGGWMLEYSLFVIKIKDL